MRVEGGSDTFPARIQSCKPEQLAALAQAHKEVSKNESTCRKRDQLRLALSHSHVSISPPSAK